MLEEISEPEVPKSETNDPSNTGLDSAGADGAPALAPVSPILNASGSATESEEQKPQPNDSSNNQSDSATGGESLSSAPVSSDLNIVRDRTKNLSIIKPRRATGPRTKEGKDRSKRNPLKHGIFSSPLLLGEEDAKVYRSFLTELTEYLDPKGALESILVEKLATNAWRHRRLLEAESSAIDKHKKELLSERDEREDECFHRNVQEELARAQSDREGLLSKIAEPDIFQDCIERLSCLRSRIGQDERHIDDVWDWIDLARVYGARFNGRSGRDLYDIYLDCANVTLYSAKELREKGLTLTEHGEKVFLIELDKEIQRLKALPKKPKPPDMELLACKVPATQDLDRLLRYEASLERAFDRTLSQLERLQRLRLGLPVAHRVEVQATVSQG